MPSPGWLFLFFGIVTAVMFWDWCKRENGN